MGGTGGTGSRCYALPSAIKIGWQSLQAQLQLSDLNTYSALSFTIPVQSSTSVAGISVDLGYDVVYISFRMQQGPFELLFNQGDTAPSVLVRTRSPQ